MIDGDHKSIFGCARSMFKDNGIRSFYQGIRSPLYAAVFINTNIFYSYSLSRNLVGIPIGTSYEKLEDKKDKINYYKKIATAGCLTGFALSFFEGPMELFKCQMQVDKEATFHSLYKKMGLTGITRGLGATHIRNIPAMGMYFFAF